MERDFRVRTGREMPLDSDVLEEKFKLQRNQHCLNVDQLSQCFDIGDEIPEGIPRSRIRTGGQKEYCFNAVNNVSFGVKNGECFGLLGVNGAGKTTCLNLIT